MEVGRKHGRGEEEEDELSFYTCPHPSKKKSSLILTPLKPSSLPSSSSSLSQDDGGDEVLLLNHLCLLEDLYSGLDGGHHDDNDDEDDDSNISNSTNNSKSKDDLVSEMIRNLERVLASNNNELGSGESNDIADQNNAIGTNNSIGKLGSDESNTIVDENDMIGENHVFIGNKTIGDDDSGKNNTSGEEGCGEVEFSDGKYSHGKLYIDEHKDSEAEANVDADADAASSTTLDPLHYASFDDDEEDGVNQPLSSASSRSEEIDLKFLLHATDDELGIPPSRSPSPSPSPSPLEKEEQFFPCSGNKEEEDNNNNSSLLEILASMDSPFALDEDCIWNHHQMNMESWIY